MEIYWPVLIGGILVVAAGVAVVRHHQDTASGVVQDHRTVVSRIGGKIAYHSKLSRTRVAGIGAVLFGGLGIVLSYVVANDRWER